MVYKILFVDDDTNIRKLIGKIIKAGNYAGIEAESGMQALDLVKSEQPDLIILDVMMPVMNGYEVCQTLRKDEQIDHIPIVFLTAQADMDSKLHGLTLGADDYISKPFEPRELLIRIENLIRLRERIHKKYSQFMIPKPGKINRKSTDTIFIEKAIAIVEKHMSNENFSVELFAKELFLSSSQVYRKINSITGHTVSDFIRSVRLERAKDLLQQKAGNITEIAFEVGFNSPAYFTKSFREKFGCTPKEFCQRAEKETR